MRSALVDIDILILAGGLGSRLNGVLADLPKVLAPIKGRAFLDYQLDYLHGLGVPRVVLSLGHRSEMVLAHLAKAKVPLRVETVVEPRPLGTAGAVAYARSAVRSDPTIVLNGDTWLEVDFAAMLEEHRKSRNTLATLACVEVDNTGRYGAVRLAADGCIDHFIEKGESHSAGLISGGAYMLSGRLLNSLLAGSGSSLERDVLPHLPQGTLRPYLVQGGNFIDIGTPESYADAAKHFAARSAKAITARAL